MQIYPATQTVAGNTRVSRNFSCGYYYILCGAYLYPGMSVTFYIGTSSVPEYLEVMPNICTNGGSGGCSGQASSHSGLGYTYSWMSNTLNIATVYGSSTSASANFWGNGVGTGSTTAQISSQGCTQTGGGTPIVKANCTYPTSETTSWYGWDPTYGSLGDWVQTLTPSGAYSGRTVTESSTGPATDSCWFSNSRIPKVTGISGGSWTVGTSSQRGPDSIGWLPGSVEVYQNQRPLLGLPLPCQYTVFQTLTITCPNCPSQVYRINVVLIGIISATGVSSGRDGQLQGEAYQIK